jgi:hypothetical protein
MVGEATQRMIKLYLFILVKCEGDRYTPAGEGRFVVLSTLRAPTTDLWPYVLIYSSITEHNPDYHKSSTIHTLAQVLETITTQRTSPYSSASDLPDTV